MLDVEAYKESENCTNI